MRRGTLRTVVAVLSVCGLAACTNDPADPPTTPRVISPAPSPSPTPSEMPTPDAATPPERPDMSRIDAETAEAVATYFLELYPYVYATGDLTEWRALSHPECIFCASVVTNVEEMVAAGEHWEGGLATSADVATTVVSDGFFNVAVTLAEAPAQRVTTDGEVVEGSPGGESLITLALVLTDQKAWLVREGQVDEPTQ